MYVCMDVCMYVCMYDCICVCVCVCACVCMGLDGNQAVNSANKDHVNSKGWMGNARNPWEIGDLWIQHEGDKNEEKT